jgi:hypothetical protein
VFFCWGVYQIFRIVYFGDWRPNTAVAEGIDTIAFLKAFFGTDIERKKRVLDAIKHIAGEHRVYVAFLVVPFLAFGAPRNRLGVLDFMLASLCVTGLVHPVLFGPARLDLVRTTSHVALVAPLLITTQWAQIPRFSARLVGLVGLGVSLAASLILEKPSEKSFCCQIARSGPIAETCLAFARQERLSRPSLANPDLGKMSFSKRFLIFDLGLLGSPTLAALRGDKRVFMTYLFDLAAPDFIEMHGGWARSYGFLQHDARFSERYVLVPGAESVGLRARWRSNIRDGIWFRTAMGRSSRMPERRLYDDLDKRLDTERIAAELRTCRQERGPLACVYVARTAYRFIPELVSSNRLPEVISLFRSSPSAAYDTSILSARSNGTWYRQVVDFARAH